MPKPFSALLIGAIVFFIACASPEKPSTVKGSEKDNSAQFQLLIDSIYAEHPATKGIILHIEAPDYGISWNGAVGADKKLKAHSPVLIASTTKMYVSAAILRLIELRKFELFQPIDGLLTPTTGSLLRSDGYDPEAIAVAHLLSNTSGIFDYVNSPDFQKRTVDDPGHQWTREEQMAMAMRDGDPLNAPGEAFSYSDMNFLLLTEIIEGQTGQPFYTAMRELLNYKQWGLNETWFNILENAPVHLAPLVQQFATSFQVDSYTLHGSVDMFGGGGIAATASDLAHFSQHLFTGHLFDAPETLELMFTNIETQDSVASRYYMGISEIDLGALKAYGHGGFWGTTVQYIPELNASVAVYLLERDEWKLYLELIEEVTARLRVLKKVTRS